MGYKNMVEDIEQRFKDKGFTLLKFNGHSGTAYYALKDGDIDTDLNWKFVSSNLEGCLLSITDKLDIWS